MHGYHFSIAEGHVIPIFEKLTDQIELLSAEAAAAIVFAYQIVNAGIEDVKYLNDLALGKQTASLVERSLGVRVPFPGITALSKATYGEIARESCKANIARVPKQCH